jgi:hypothetical protein
MMANSGSGNGSNNGSGGCDAENSGAGCNTGDLTPKSAAKLLNLPLETPLCPCLGLGIVRSIDTTTRMLYVLTPVPADVLKQANLLLKGSLRLPVS